MWVRGLKLLTVSTLVITMQVAPHVGAWIETRGSATLTVSFRQVAPHVGAWIETAKWLINRVDISSRTPCGCVD